jgi:hypothetical protein
MSRPQWTSNPTQVMAPLLCHECEQRFNRNGETEVLRWIAPKAKKGASPLASALRDGTPIWNNSELACYPGASLIERASKVDVVRIQVQVQVGGFLRVQAGGSAVGGNRVDHV